MYWTASLVLPFIRLMRSQNSAPFLAYSARLSRDCSDLRENLSSFITTRSTSHWKSTRFLGKLTGTARGRGDTRVPITPIVLRLLLLVSLDSLNSPIRLLQLRFEKELLVAADYTPAVAIALAPLSFLDSRDLSKVTVAS